MSVPTITPAELMARARGGQPVELIDVRTPVEYREVHAAGAKSMPLDELDPAGVLATRAGAVGEPLYFLCRSGGRARTACERFLAAGFANAVCVEGGTVAWEQAGGEVVRGRGTISLERQVRIAAGLIVLAGAVLALAVHPWFAVVPVVIGAGLAFAGITNTCGMGMLLAKMPWNREPVPAACAVRRPVTEVRP